MSIVFDLDDTLIDTSDIYYKARSRFLDLMESIGLDRDKSLIEFESIDSEMMHKLNHAPERYGLSMLRTFERFSPNIAKSERSKITTQLKKYGDIVTSNFPVVIDGAHELLRWSNDRYRLAVLTRGQEAFQKRKLRVAGLEHYFQVVQVVNKKDGSALLALLTSMGLKPEDSWVIGDSIKSDILPAKEIGARSILYEYKHPYYIWQQEYDSNLWIDVPKVSKLTDAITFLDAADKK